MKYERIVIPVFEDKADVVYGSRFKEGICNGYLPNRLADWFLTKLSNLFTGLDCTVCRKLGKKMTVG